MPGRPATDLDLFSVKTTIGRQYSEDLVRTGAVRVITVGDQVHVRNTLQSDRWRMHLRGPGPSGSADTYPGDALFNSKLWVDELQG
jgi:hypothetical protein